MLHVARIVNAGKRMNRVESNGMSLLEYRAPEDRLLLMGSGIIVVRWSPIIHRMECSCPQRATYSPSYDQEYAASCRSLHDLI